MARREAPTFAGVATFTELVEGRTRLVGVTIADAEGRVCIAQNPEGISTVEALEFLGAARDQMNGARLVTFGGRHDVTQWLAGAPRGVLRALWHAGEARWHRSAAAEGADRYSLRMIDGLVFSVWREGWPNRVRINDVSGLFPGATLWEACDAWGVDVVEAARGVCLARLMDRVAARGRELGLAPQHWGGAGSIAAAMLRGHKAKRHLPEEPHAPELREAIMTAYYGGRVDMLQQGECARVLALDMRSAYPWALSRAPSMRGEWRYVTAGAGGIDAGELAPFGVYRVRFESPRIKPLSPLPVRTLDRVAYPASGQGWWHACELAAAARAGTRLDVLEGWIFTPALGEPERPFAWLEDVYAQRAELRMLDDPGEGLVKVALNAVYGKLAQSHGSASYQCFELAGWVTAMVRAAMLDVAMLIPSAVISIHTDGLLLDATRGHVRPEDPNLPGYDFEIGEGMGEWEEHYAQRLLIVQPGVYTYDEPGVGAAESRRLAGRQRGIPQRGLSWERVELEWREYGTAGRVTLEQEMHHGIGTCAGKRRWGTLGQWVRESRTVSFAATSRFPSSSWSGGLQTMMPVAWAGPAIPYVARDEPDADEQLRREQPA